MTTPAHRTGPRRACRSRGQAMVEYLVASAVVLALIAIPIDGSDSPLGWLLQAVRTAYDRFVSTISLSL